MSVPVIREMAFYWKGDRVADAKGLRVEFCPDRAALTEEFLGVLGRTSGTCTIALCGHRSRRLIRLVTPYARGRGMKKPRGRSAKEWSRRAWRAHLAGLRSRREALERAITNDLTSACGVAE